MWQENFDGVWPAEVRFGGEFLFILAFTERLLSTTFLSQRTFDIKRNDS